jgi:hypothetical protein
MRADRQEPGRRCQRHRCRPRPAQDQRQLAEEVSRRQRRDETVLPAYLCSAFDQDEERVRDGRVFVDQRVTRWKIDLVSELRNRDTITFRAPREERHGREQFRCCRAAKRHPQSLSRGGRLRSNRTGPSEHTDAFYVLEGELTFEFGARGRDDHGLLRRIRRRAAAGSPLVPQRQRPPRALVNHPRTRRWFRRLHARARDGVEVEWDIYTVPARGGLPGKRSDRQPRRRPRAPPVRESTVLADAALGRAQPGFHVLGCGTQRRRRRADRGRCARDRSVAASLGPTGDSRTGLTRRLALPRIGIGRLR